MRSLHVYILASTARVLYIGISNNLYGRVAQHRAGLSRFTRRYRVHRLVFVEEATGPRSAIAREKQLKRWTRARKIALIEYSNPKWIDLARDWPSLDVILHSRAGASPCSPRPLDGEPGSVRGRVVEIPRFAQDDGGRGCSG